MYLVLGVEFRFGKTITRAGMQTSQIAPGSRYADYCSAIPISVFVR